MGKVLQVDTDFTFAASQNPMSDGGRWVGGYTSFNSLKLVSNRVQATALNADSLMVRGDAPAGWDQWVELTIATIAQGTGFNIAIQAAIRQPAPGANTGYFVLAKAGGFGTTTEIFGGSFSSGNSTETWGSGDKLLVEARGSTFKIYRNGNLVLTATDNVNDVGGVGPYTGIDIFVQGGTVANAEISRFRSGPIATYQPNILRPRPLAPGFAR